MNNIYENMFKRAIEFNSPLGDWPGVAGGGMPPGFVPQLEDNGASQQKRKKRSRWGTVEEDKAIPGMPASLPPGLDESQQKQYILHLQIEEISRKVRTGDLGIPINVEDRSPSPEPIYNNEGKRLNTRDYRMRKKLEEDRHKLVQEALALNTDYKPPADYKPPIIRVSDKVMIPQDDHPDINFVGLLIGPRGNTLKNLEKETGAKIIIRGKGSVKEGKIGRKDGQPLPGEDEPLHAYVTANNPEYVKIAVEKIKVIIKQGIEVPEGENDLRRQQLRELALLNGTLRESDGLAKLKQLQQAQTIVTNTIICTLCGGTGHIAKDCMQKRPGDTFRMQQMQSPADKAKMDIEYMSLMAELGEGPAPQKPPEPVQPPRPPFTVHPALPGFNFQGGMRHPLVQQMSGQQQGMSPHQGMPLPFNQQSPQFRNLPPQMTGSGPMQGQMQGGPMQNAMNIGQQQQQMQGSPQIMGLPPQMHQQSPQQQHLTGSVNTSMSMSGPPGMWQQHNSPGMMGSSNAPPPPPQQQTNISAAGQIIGVSPVGMLRSPPPPPPNSQSVGGQTVSWIQQQQNTSPAGLAPPPPPTSTLMMQQQPPWQQQSPGQQGGMAPPPPPSSIGQWQSAPPPPPVSRGGFRGLPPPPPPGTFDVQTQLQAQVPRSMNMNPMMVTPPPPPPN